MFSKLDLLKNEWVEDKENKGVYRLKIFEDNSRLATHRLTIQHYPDSPEVPFELSPLSEESRKGMWNPECKGPLEKTLIDSILSIAKFDSYDGHLPAFDAYFLEGKLKYANEHGPGIGDTRSMMKDFYTAENFKNRIIKYFELNNYDQFATFFTKSNLPESHKQSIKDIL